MNKLRIIILACFVMFFAVSCSSKKDEKFELAQVKRGDILASIAGTGSVTPRNRLEIKPPVSGRIEQIVVKEGDKVKKGEILGWISSMERATLIDAARAKGENEVKYWEDLYKPAPIIAPIDGFIIQKNVEPGQTFSSSDTVLVMADKLIVEAQVDETDIGSIKLGQKSTIVLDAYPAKTIPGFVEQIAYESETVNNVTVYQVKVLPSVVPSFFKSGMSATINFMISEKNNVLTLPSSAVKKRGTRSYVFVKDGDSYKTMQIQAGLENTDSIEIVSGLGEGAEVIIPTAKMIQESLAGSSRRGPQMNFFNKKGK